jgi:YD repeat-containing protein
MSIRLAAGIGALTTIVTGCGENPTGPPGQTTAVLIQRTTSWFAGAPENRQVGEFVYDSEGYLRRYEFSHNLTGSWRTTIKKEVLYRDDRLTRGHDLYLRGSDGVWWLSRVVRYVYPPDATKPTEVRLEAIEERTGNVIFGTVEIGYDAQGRIAEERTDEQVIRYVYDGRGNATEIRNTYHDVGTQLSTLTFSDARNPFADFPPRLDVHRGIWAPDAYSAHLSKTWANAVEGEAPAAQATATVDTNANGYPRRREYTVWNTADPDNRSVLITEYKYVGSGS